MQQKLPKELEFIKKRKETFPVLLDWAEKGDAMWLLKTLKSSAEKNSETLEQSAIFLERELTTDNS